MARRGGQKFDPLETASGRPVRPSGADHPPLSLSDRLSEPDPDKLKAQIEEMKPPKIRDAGALDKALARARIIKLADWSHKNEGTPETHAHAARTRQGALARLYQSGAIDADQLAWATEIASVAESIERDVAPVIVNYEPRIDCSASGKDSLVEGIMRVRREVAYGYWRGWIPQPKRAVLDMIVGDARSYSTVAREWRMSHRRAKRMLIDSIDLWPAAMERAEDEVDDASLAAAYAGLI